GVVPALGEALSKRQYAELTPVQLAVLAAEAKDADMLVSAQTGSGKTVAFGLTLAPTLLEGEERFSRAGKPLALAIAPTRELALQVQRELQWLYEMTGASVVSCVGGMDTRTERQTLARGAHIVVGTPGRLRDHIERGALDLSGLKAVVLDEADEMLDMGFRDDLEFILGSAPAERRTLMFSATVPRAIANLAKRYQRDAIRIVTSSEKEQHLDIDYRAFTVAANDRENAIINVLRYFEASTAIVFCATRATVNRMTSRFTNRGFSVVALSGELSQAQRTHALQSLRDGRARLCIATDVAARGLDLPNLELVIHADLPKNRESLLHRSGRTGRAGRKGVSALIVPHNARKRTERLFQTANIEATWAKPPSVNEITQRDDERILDDPALAEPVQENERAFAQGLLDRYGAEQVAAAFVRLQRAGRSAPEELDDTPLRSEPSERAPRSPRAPRKRDTGGEGQGGDRFKDSVWLSVSVGRKHTAEPRWLLPMLCRAGEITNREIGAIRIQETITFVELTAGSVDKFLEALGPSRKLEKTITVDRLKEMPAVLSDPSSGADAIMESSEPTAPRAPAAPRREKPYEKRKTYAGPKPAPRAARTSNPNAKPKPTQRFDRPRDDEVTTKPDAENAVDSFGERPSRKPQSKAKKKGKKKFQPRSGGKPSKNSWENTWARSAEPAPDTSSKKSGGKKKNRKARAALADEPRRRIMGTLSVKDARPVSPGSTPLKRKRPNPTE
ncbi:MAG: DEAD/DEAH box helicase, partial [Proteobacteria bacterium]|nr:DEAD/DEAH box helicase [Pseudomonadota bacterium]